MVVYHGKSQRASKNLMESHAKSNTFAKNSFRYFGSNSPGMNGDKRRFLALFCQESLYKGQNPRSSPFISGLKYECQKLAKVLKRDIIYIARRCTLADDHYG